MIQAAGGTGLARDGGDVCDVDPGGAQDLDRDIPPDPRVACAVNLTHPALAEKPDDLVRSEAIAGREGHALFEPFDGAERNLRVAFDALRRQERLFDRDARRPAG